MSKRIGAVTVLVSGVLATAAAPAVAQDAGVDQYTPGTGTTTTPAPANPSTGTTAPGGGVEAAQSANPSTSTTPDTSGAVTPSGRDGSPLGSAVKDKTGTGAPGTTPAGTRSAAPASAASGVLAGNRVAFLQFGTAPRELQGDVLTALDRVGLQVLFEGDANRRRLVAFLRSPAARALSAEGPNAVGKAVGAQLVTPTPVLTTAFPVIFGPATTFVPVIRAVLTRRAGLSAGEVAFQLGVAEGLKSTGVPLAYVERTGTKPTFASDYEKLDVPVVDDVDTDAGKRRLGLLMLGQGDAALKADRSAAAVPTAGGDADPATLAGYGGVLLLLGGAAVWGSRGVRRGRRRVAR